MREFLMGLAVLMIASVAGVTALYIAAIATGSAPMDNSSSGYAIPLVVGQLMIALPLAILPNFFVVWRSSVRHVAIAALSAAVLMIGAALLLFGRGLVDAGGWTRMLVFVVPMLVMDLVLWGIISLYVRRKRS